MTFAVPSLVKVLGFGLAATGAALTLAWALTLPTQSFSLPVKDKGTIAYTCRQTSTPQEAKTRALAAHTSFQAGLDAAAATLAPQIMAAMQKASTTGDRADLEQANADYMALSKTLRADLLATYGCTVDTTLQADN